MADRLPAQRSQGSQDAHEDLLAALAASRELGPEMDKTLAERYLEKHGQPAPAPAQQRAVGQPSGISAAPLLGGLGFLAGMAIFAIAVVATGGHALGFFWLPLALCAWLWWGPFRGWGRHGGWYGPRDYWRQQRRDARDDYRAWRRGDPSMYPPSQGSDPRRSDDML